jgi:hypothetical protein
MGEQQSTTDMSTPVAFRMPPGSSLLEGGGTDAALLLDANELYRLA